MQEHPVGTGPYKLVKWDRKHEHLVVRNDDYWGAKPYYTYVRIRIIPEQATQIAELVSGGVDVIKAVPPDQMDVINKSGQARTASSPILRTAFLQLDQAGRSGPNPFTDRRVRQAANLATNMDGIIKHVLNGLGDRVATAVNPMAFGFDPGLKPYKQDLAAAKKLLAEAGYPNGVDITYNQGPPTVEPGLLQTDEAIVADLTKAGFRVKQNYIGDNTVFVARVKDNKGGPMFSFSWGYYSVFDADAILHDIFKCKETYSYYCNPAMDDLIVQGRSTLDQKKRADIYVKAQKLIYDDAAYLFKWGLLGLDQPVYVQYWKFASRAVLGDFGKSWYTDTPAFNLVLQRMPPTLYLTAAGLVAALLIALPLGILAALKRHSFVDNCCTAIAVAGQAMPIFWLGIMLIIIFAVRLKTLPASGYGTWQHFLMPAFTLGAFLAPITMRLVRSGVIEIMNTEYIRPARAKGVGERTVVVKHAFRNACIPVITVLGLQFGQLLGGAIVTETVFAWPGVATLTVDSIRNQDFPVVQCAVILLALIIVSVNFLVDLIVGLIDPRIRIGA